MNGNPVRLMTWTMTLLLACSYVAAGTGRLVVDLEAGEYELEGSPEGTILKVEGFGNLVVPGAPLLPMKRFQILLPPGARAVSVELLEASSIEMELDGFARPSEGFYPLTSSPWLETELAELESQRQLTAEAVYGSDSGYPERVAWLAGAGTYRKFAYASVAFCPFIVHPLSGRLLLHESIQVAVDYVLPEPGSSEALHVERTMADEVGTELAERLFCNHDEMAPLYPIPDNGRGSDAIWDLVIITTTNLAEAVEASSFIEWKEYLGHSVRIVLTTDPEIAGQTGDDLEAKMRSFLREHYIPWGIEAVLFVGDYALVPMRICYPDPSYHVYDPSNPGLVAPGTPTDAYYADLSYIDAVSWDLDNDGFPGEYGQDRPDFMPEVVVGRIPVNSPGRVTSVLDKSVVFEQDQGAWKKNVLHAGTILFFENQNHGGGPFIDGATLLDSMETAFMSGWTVTHMSEQAGLVTSLYPWPAVSEASFSGNWRSGEHAVVNWSGHGWPDGAARTVWEWDDGDGVPESGGELSSYSFIHRYSTTLEDDRPSVVFAISCDVGFPEPNSWGRCGVDLLATSGWGASIGVVSASRPAAVAGAWAVTGGGTEQVCYDFNRHLMQEEASTGMALYMGKYDATTNYGWEHIYEYMNLYNLNLYGDPTLMIAGFPVGIAGESATAMQAAPELSGCEPNPFSSTATLRITLPGAGGVSALVFDLSGRVVATFADDAFPAGESLLVWDGRDACGRQVGEGIYYAVVRAGGSTMVRRMVLIR